MTVTLTLTLEELSILDTALQNMPYKDVVQFINNINQQLMPTQASENAEASKS